MPEDFDIIVVGGGHAGCEAALAAARMGCSVLLITMERQKIGLMSCNPAIGGIGKGQLVREIDALGGEMAKAADETGIMFHRLNMSRGQAVVSSRVQCDRNLYNQRMVRAVSGESGIRIEEGIVNRLIIKGNYVVGVQTTSQDKYFARAVILTTGTFLNGLMHFGLTQKVGGRYGEPACSGLTEQLQRYGFRTGRLKTGTPARLKKDTIDFSVLDVQNGDIPPTPLSFSTEEINREQVPCYITYTNERTKEVVLRNLDKSPLYSGVIVGIGPRYCPSFEDKCVKFKERNRHQVFLEPEGLESDEIYPNGLSSSLPPEVQLEFLRTIKGLENVEVSRFGYAVEYDFVDPTQLKHTLESKIIDNLFLAGQINGTSGYEEAGAQGLIAGINAALKIKKKKEFILQRNEAYIGVLIDDLVTRGVTEPYRMFTSRVEFRLLLREDNADMRLREKGYMLGLVGEEEYRRFKEKKRMIEEEIAYLSQRVLYPDEKTQCILKEMGTEPIKKPITLKELLRRNGITYEMIKKYFGGNSIDKKHIPVIETEVKFEGYIKREIEEVKRFQRAESEAIPPDINYSTIPGLSKELREKLERIRPQSLGQASRIPGMTPSALCILMYTIRALNNGVRNGRG